MAAKLQAGRYAGRVLEAAIKEAESGAVMLSMIIEVGPEQTVMRGGICLIRKDGQPSQRGHDDLCAIFGVDEINVDDWSREPSAWAGAEVEVVVEVKQGDHGEFSSIKYINPPRKGRGGGSDRHLEPTDKSVFAKLGVTASAPPGAPAKPAKPAKPAAPEDDIPF